LYNKIIIQTTKKKWITEEPQINEPPTDNIWYLANSWLLAFNQQFLNTFSSLPFIPLFKFSKKLKHFYKNNPKISQDLLTQNNPISILANIHQFKI